jgi:hypothetical protein
MQHNLARPSPSISHDLPATHPDGIPLPNPSSVPDSTQDSRSATIRFRPPRARLKPRGRGLPRLRTAAWRAMWALPHNPVYAARFEHLTTRVSNPLKAAGPGVAIARCAARRRANPAGFLGPGDRRWPAPGDLRDTGGSLQRLLWVLMG